MRCFDCACGARVFFENVRCLSCASELGFVPDVGVVSALGALASGDYSAAGHPDVIYRKCRNYAEQGVCNWMVASEDSNALCLACRLNQVIPDLSFPENREKWGRVELAKRRLVYTLNRLRLPLVPRSLDPERGLAFDIKADTPNTRVLTGHADGLVTLNLAEADPLLREKMRLALNERYRTLLGHFRHEVGHYYWDVLIRDGTRLEDFRALFGDDRQDYAEALRAYYEHPPLEEGWTGDFVSAYAQAHPWEDWAETWAHYLHMIDTLETAQSFGVVVGGEQGSAYALGQPFEKLINAWLELVIALNAMNRSMGLPDAYPFPIGERAKTKLAFVHELLGRLPSRADRTSVIHPQTA